MKEAKQSTLEQAIISHFRSRYSKVDLERCKGCDNLDVDTCGYCCMVIGECHREDITHKK